MEEVLTQDQILEIKNILQAQFETISQEREEKLFEIRNGQDSLKDAADIASYEGEVEKIQWLIEKNRRLEKKILNALNRFGQGRFGHCEECDSLISYKRLRIDPTCELCIYCKNDQEDGRIN